jgi:hypothetical protein
MRARAVSRELGVIPGAVRARGTLPGMSYSGRDPGRDPSSPPPDTRPRPMIERIGLAAIALVMAAMFGIVAVAAFLGGEPFLGAMGALGCLMVIWVGGLTLLRG